MKPGPTLMKHFLQFKDLRAEEYAYLFARSATIKTRFKNYEKYTPLVDRTLAMIHWRGKPALNGRYSVVGR